MKLSALFKIDFRRQWIAHSALALASFVVGLSVLGAFRIQSRMSSMLRPPEWGAIVALLPKGVTLESLNEDIQTGHPRAFLPKVLFESLRGQVLDEQERKGFAHASLDMFAVLPVKSMDGRKHIMSMGPIPATKEPWLTTVQDLWHASPDAQTPEWGEEVVEAIFANGSMEAAKNLKILADRRTVAQAIMIEDETEIQREKAAKLLTQVWMAVSLVVICGLLTLLLSLRLTSHQRQNLFDVLELLGFSEKQRSSFVTSQFLIYLALPMLAGGLIAAVVA